MIQCGKNKCCGCITRFQLTWNNKRPTRPRKWQFAKPSITLTNDCSSSRRLQLGSLAEHLKLYEVREECRTKHLVTNAFLYRSNPSLSTPRERSPSVASGATTASLTVNRTCMFIQQSPKQSTPKKCEVYLERWLGVGHRNQRPAFQRFQNVPQQQHPDSLEKGSQLPSQEQQTRSTLY